MSSDDTKKCRGQYRYCSMDGEDRHVHAIAYGKNGAVLIDLQHPVHSTAGQLMSALRSALQEKKVSNEDVKDIMKSFADSVDTVLKAAAGRQTNNGAVSMLGD